MIGLDNPIHLALLLMILLLVFGAKRLPEMGRSLGAGLRGFKDSVSGIAPTEPAEPAEHVAQLDAAAALVPSVTAAADAVRSTTGAGA